MQPSYPTRAVPNYRGPAEVAFGLEPMVVTDNTAESVMNLGAWALHEDGSTVHPGAAGVLIDNVTAYAVLSARDADQWAVTSAISVDFHSPISPGTQRLTCRAAVDHCAEGWGHSSGQLRTDSGALVATVGQRMRYFPGDDSPHNQPDEPVDATSWLSSLDSRLALNSQAGNQSEFLLKSDPGMRNPLGTLHGGISLGMSELAARKAWEASADYPGAPFRTSAIRMSYLRPGVVDNDFEMTVTIIHSSRSVVLAEVRSRNADGKTITFGLVTLHRILSFS